MRNVYVSDTVRRKILELRTYLVIELKLSEKASYKRIERMKKFILTFGYEADYALCRFKKWQLLGYRCAVFEKCWVFAYEVIDGGVIVRDLSHTAMLTE